MKISHVVVEVRPEERDGHRCAHMRVKVRIGGKNYQTQRTYTESDLESFYDVIMETVAREMKTVLMDEQAGDAEA